MHCCGYLNDIHVCVCQKQLPEVCVRQLCHVHLLSHNKFKLHAGSYLLLSNPFIYILFFTEHRISP